MLTPSARLDAHSDYATRISPKIASLFEWSDDLRLRASIGSGYKAPAFRQLYLTYTNPRVGYTVLGAEYLQSELQALNASGQIQSFLRDPSGFGATINAERSAAFNAGFDASLTANLAWQVNLYHNEIRELIDTQPVATKTNGQQVFSYFNRGSVFTRGVETQLSWRPASDLRTTVSYTFLDARDRDVLDDLRAGRIYRRDENGRDERVPTSDYAGLSGRSRHAGTLQIAYTFEELGLTAATQARYRSRYGFGDVNGNSIVDIDAEYAPGYAVIDLTLTQSLFAEHEFAVGVQNLNGRRDARHTPHLSGREFFAELHLSF
jgi:outer membrane receptor for ferrienterochelin and colicins